MAADMDADIDRFVDAVAARLGKLWDDRPLLSPLQVAERLDMSERTVRELIGDGGPTAELPSFKVRGARKVSPADLDAYIAARRGPR